MMYMSKCFLNKCKIYTVSTGQLSGCQNLHQHFMIGYIQFEKCKFYFIGIYYANIHNTTGSTMIVLITNTDLLLWSIFREMSRGSGSGTRTLGVAIAYYTSLLQPLVFILTTTPGRVDHPPPPPPHTHTHTHTLPALSHPRLPSLPLTHTFHCQL